MEEVRDKDVTGLYHMALREVGRPAEEPQKTPCVVLYKCFGLFNTLLGINAGKKGAIEIKEGTLFSQQQIQK